MTNLKLIAGASALLLAASPAMANSSVSVYAKSSGVSSVSGSVSAGVSSSGKSFVSGSVSATGNARVSASATAGNKSISFNQGPVVVKEAPTPFYDITIPTITFDLTTLLAQFRAWLNG